MFSSVTTGNTVAKEYGFKQLTFGRRVDTHDYAGDLLSNTSDKIVARNIKLEDVEILYAACNNGHNLKGWTKQTLYPYHVTFKDGYLYAQFSVVNAGMSKCVKVRFCQQGNDVAVRIMYAAYIENLEDPENDFDVNYTRNNWKVITQENYKEGDSNQGYGIDVLCLRSKAKDKLTFAVSGTLAIDMPIGGDDVNTLSVTGADGKYPIAISNSLNAETLAKIRLNGKRVVQAANGRLVARGLTISVF